MRDASELRSALRAGGPVVGLWAVIPSSVTAEVAAQTGAGYVVVDQLHGAVDQALLTAMLQAIRGAGAAPLVRVAANDPWVIGNALDLGAVGVIVPMVEDGEQAALAVSSCRYAPAGRRSFGALRGGSGAEPLCLVMVETRAGLEHAGEIAATPGLDGIYIGPSDLALSLGLEPTPRLEHEPVLQAIDRVRAACAEQGVICGLHCLNPDDAARFGAAGVAMVTAGGDLSYLRQMLGEAFRRATGRGVS